MILFSIIYIIISAVLSLRLNRTNLLDSRQKRVNVFLVWVLPVLWWLVILAMPLNEPLKVITKKERDKGKYVSNPKHPPVIGS
ncbi:MAG: hypothetical protein MRZ79_11735 [Bacteroidia bacterium]|nr:hypothetical protein [Bacteroidia bacterium]